RPRTTVTLRVSARAERVLIEIEDECHGLPDGHAEELFRPFAQRSADRTGMGLGLAFSRWGVEANKGRISARNLARTGCVFTVDLPRVAVPAAVPQFPAPRSIAAAHSHVQNASDASRATCETLAAST